jgi:hydroxylamine reductase
MLSLRDSLKSGSFGSKLHDAAVFCAGGRDEMLNKASNIGVMSTVNEDVRSLRELIIYGIKGMAAYAEHAYNLGKEDVHISAFIYEALAATLDD